MTAERGEMTVGVLLRAWRVDVARMTLAEAASRAGLAESTLSQWETGRRHARRVIAVDQLRALDTGYGAQGALADLVQACGTPSGLPARITWAHNRQGPSRPGWAWLRPRPGAGQVTARLLWGAFRRDISQACDDRGAFVTAPVSMPNPAVWVHLREPGWVDFGEGVVPEALGVPVLDALSGAELSEGGHSPAGLVAPSLVDRFESDPAWADEVLAFFGARSDLVERVFRTRDTGGRVSDLTGQRPGSAIRPPRSLPGSDYRRLREARGLSRADVATLATALLPDDPVSDDQVAVVEAGGHPQSSYLPARVDSVYRADGQTCIEAVPVRGTRSPFVVDFPLFWIGPVWFTLRAPPWREPVGDARVEWDRGFKRLRVRSGVTVCCRRPGPEPIPFRVVCPDGWTVTAGVGAHPDACDVNWGWLDLADPGVPSPPAHELFLEFFGRSAAEFARLVDDRSGPTDARDP